MPVTRHSFLRAAGAVVVAAGLVGLAGPASASSAAPAAASPGRAPIRVGSVLVPPCKASRLAWCTTIPVPYDYFDKAAGTIRLGFRWYPATGGHSSRTIV